MEAAGAFNVCRFRFKVGSNKQTGKVWYPAVMSTVRGSTRSSLGTDVNEP